jgi:Gas vesicle protein
MAEARGSPPPARHVTTLAAPEAGANLADVLERVLDKGIVIAGDIQINLLDIELLTIKLRLIVASVDTARRMGICWWETDPMLTGSDDHEGGRSIRGPTRRLERPRQSSPSRQSRR